MSTSDQTTKQALFLFLLAAATTFVFITIMQFMSPPWFFIALVMMHVGIALFIVSRRRFGKLDVKVSSYYSLQYALLIQYLLMMFYSFAVRAGLIPAHGTGKLIAVLAYTAFVAVITFWNYARMKRDIENHFRSE